MIALRAAKAALVAAIALLASLVVFGNVTDYNTNFVFVEHVLSCRDLAVCAVAAGDF